MLPSRYLAFAIACMLCAASLAAALVVGPQWWSAFVALSALVLVGVRDLTQTRQAIRRNYPLLSHFRFFFERIRPEIRQYLLEDDTEELPFSRVQRSIVYQRAKNEVDKRPFGTQLDVYAPRTSGSTTRSPDRSAVARFPHRDRRRTVRPAVFGERVQHLGDEFRLAGRPMRSGTERGREARRILPRHRRGLDLAVPPRGAAATWSGRSARATSAAATTTAAFSASASRENAASDAGEDDRGEAVAGRQARPRRRAAGGEGQRPKSPPRAACRSASTASRRRGIRRSPRPRGLLEFVAELRQLSGGKPTGFKLAIGHPWEWFGIAKAMHETGILPDFIVVDGGEGGTGAAPLEFTDHVGAPLREALMLVHNTLVGLNLRERVRIGASRQDRHRLRHRAHAGAGRRLVQFAARGFMFALGCIQSRKAAIPAAARPASPPRTRCASARSSCPTRANASTSSI
jgi:hypothetical protein